MGTWFAVFELPFLLVAIIFGILIARTVRSSKIGRGMTFIALGSLIMAIGHIIMIVNGLVKEQILSVILGDVGGAWAWLVALCTSWLFYGLGFVDIYKVLPEKEAELLQKTRSHEQARDALRHSEDLYRSLVESVRDVIYTLSPEGRLTSLNPAFELYTGWSCSEWIGQPFAPLVHTEDVPLAMEIFHRAIAGENPPLFTLRIREKSGNYRIGEFMETPQIRDGRVVGILGVGRDATERIQAEEALRKAHDELELRVKERTIALSKANEELTAQAEALQASEVALREANETLRALFHASPLPIIAMYPEGIVTMWNRAAERIFGWSKQDVLGRPTPVVPEAKREEFHALRERVLRGESVTLMETQRQKKDGSLIEVSIATAPIYGANEEIRGIIVVYDDITERKRAEEGLRESEERFRSVTESANDAIIVGDHHGRILSWNRGAQIMFGYTEAALLNQPLTLLMPTRYHEAHGRAIARLNQTGETKLVGRTVDLEGLRKDGTEFPLELSLSMWSTRAGAFFGGIIRDLTERKRDEQARARLAELVFEEAERRRIARELHDQIGQMLKALKLTLEIAERRPEAALWFNLEEAQQLVDDLMKRVQDMSLDLRPPMLDDLGLLPALLWLFQRCAAQTNVQVTFEHSRLDRRFASDVETAAYRIVQEALTNVARHAGVKNATVRLWADGTMLGMQIEDQGIGFAVSSTPVTALGLTGMQERAHALGGQLTVESEPGRGTRVTAELPLNAPIEQRRLMTA